MLFYFYSFELQIVKPAKRKLITKLPTEFKVHGSRWCTILLGGFTCIVMLAGLSLLAPSIQSPPKHEVISYALISLIILSVFLNQIILEGKIEVYKNRLEFNYRSIFGLHVRTEGISSYRNIWVQKMRPTVTSEADDGRPYFKVLLNIPGIDLGG